ncbi:MAG: DUF4339 domain-containing protein, partial [Bdellovibrionota bacterium]
MDGYQEKKWFVYLGDHHEGPFSIDEIESRMTSGQLSRSTYVWAEGMSDWEPMTDVSAFISVVGEREKSLSATESVRSTTTSAHTDANVTSATLSKQSDSLGLELETKHSITPGQAASTPARYVSNPFNQKVELDQSAKLVLDPLNRPQSYVEIVGVSKVSSVPRIIKNVVILIAIGYGFYMANESGRISKFLESAPFRAAIRVTHDLTRPFLVKLSQSFPLAKRWISPIPFFEDVTSGDYAELKDAATTSLERDGPRVALAASTADLSAPAFYITSNLPNGAWIELFIEGISDTLLNQIQFTAKAQIQIMNNHGKSQPIRYADGKQIPRGQYLIYVSESSFQEPAVKSALHNARLANFQALNSLPKGRVIAIIPRSAKLIAGKTYFLGGPKDDTYHSRLKEFHDKITARATKEL